MKKLFLIIVALAIAVSLAFHRPGYAGAALTIAFGVLFLTRPRTGRVPRVPSRKRRVGPDDLLFF